MVHESLRFNAHESYRFKGTVFEFAELAAKLVAYWPTPKPFDVVDLDQIDRNIELWVLPFTRLETTGHGRVLAFRWAPNDQRTHLKVELIDDHWQKFPNQDGWAILYSELSQRDLIEPSPYATVTTDDGREINIEPESERAAIEAMGGTPLQLHGGNWETFATANIAAQKGRDNLKQELIQNFGTADIKAVLNSLRASAETGAAQPAEMSVGKRRNTGKRVKVKADWIKITPDQLQLRVSDFVSTIWTDFGDRYQVVEVTPGTLTIRYTRGNNRPVDVIEIVVLSSRVQETSIEIDALENHGESDLVMYDQANRHLALMLWEYLYLGKEVQAAETSAGSGQQVISIEDQRIETIRQMFSGTNNPSDKKIAAELIISESLAKKLRLKAGIKRRERKKRMS